jgi:hypothetical protein
MTHKVILKDAKERHIAQLIGKISAKDLCTPMSTFKPCDYPFIPVNIEDEPMTLKSEILHQHVEKLPTYLMKFDDDYIFKLCLKLSFSIIKYLNSYEKSCQYMNTLCSLFNLECVDTDDVSWYEFSDGDRDLLINILAPHIFNKQTSDEESEQSVGGVKDPNREKEESKDWISFELLENQTCLELIESECFKPSNQSNSVLEDAMLNISPDHSVPIEEKVKKEQFIPYFKKEYNVIFGSPNYFLFFRCFYTMYERLRLTYKIISDRVDDDFKLNKDEVLHSYHAYNRSHDKIKENRGIRAPQATGDSIPDESEDTVKRAVTRHRMAILIGIAMTRYRGKLDGNTYEDLVRVFLGVKAFFFFTFDKLILTTQKAFQALFSDEHQKSSAWTLFEKYNAMKGNQREKL